jgi:hypothetical protein
MRYLLPLTFLCVASCINNVTAAGDASPIQAYTLATVDQDSLPVRTGNASTLQWVLSGSLSLQPNGYFILLERDSTWNGRAFSRTDRTEGGLWAIDGAVLTLSDTATGEIDSYGAPEAPYFGSIAPNVVLLTIPAESGSGSHLYRYQR